ncbi:MAG TPA: GGDEF domain-containing protein [Dissulfurispiraceae bacterium]|nr:GGDEF domain-containing protein [Dissulfurispiraceae bacterium]
MRSSIIVNATTEAWQDGENPEITPKVHAAQIQQLYKQTSVGLIGLAVITILVCFDLWHVFPHWKLSSWAGASLFVIISRSILTAVYRRKSPYGPDIYLWAKLHVVSANASALLWATASLFLWPANSPVHQLIWPICIVAVSAAALAMYCTWTPSYLSYLLISVTPISLRFLFGDETTYIVLGLLGLLFIATLAQTGRVMHTATRQALIMGIRNEALNQHLAEEKAKQDELNRELQAAHDQLNRLSMTDELTGLWNRRYLNATIPEDVAQVIRSYHNVNNGLP